MYEVNLKVNAHHLRLVSDGSLREVYFDGVPVDRYSTCTSMGLGCFVFEVEEGEEVVVYDIVVVGGPAPSCFVGRNGDLIFSDAPGFEIDRTDDAA